MEENNNNQQGGAPEQNQGMNSSAPMGDQNAPNAQAGGAPASAEGMPLSKIIAIAGYIFPFLFFLPLVIDSLKENKASRFHANQQLLILIIYAAAYVLGMFMFMFWGLIQLVQLAAFILAIIGAVNAAQDKEKELPLIGHFHII